MNEAIQVTILGQIFTLRSDAAPDEVRRIADFVNKELDAIAASGRTVDSLNVSLLALLNVAQAYLRLRDASAREMHEANMRLDRLIQRVENETRQGEVVSGTTSLFGDFR